MKTKKRFASSNLADILKHARSIKISNRDKFIIFSDLHMGNGGRMDDFLSNHRLFSYVLSNYYLQKGYGLILNGDVEELQKFNLQGVQSYWQSMYAVFREFEKHKRLFKLLGNHDDGLQFHKNNRFAFELHEAVKLVYGKNTIFVFHGHQASFFYEKFNTIIRFFLRVFANPLHIKNYSVAGDNKKKHRLEKKAYRFARNKKIIAVIGHTHRPLFESQSKVEAYRKKIDELCREYPKQNTKQQKHTQILIDNLKDELIKLTLKKKNYIPSIYDTHLIVPCLFNSGCVIAKRGITGIEIAGGEIALVHWFDKEVSKKYLNDPLITAEQLKKSNYHKAVLEKEQLNYIFTRIKLLT
ncbi:MAG: metallophosphoesterase family protein [Spirochaetales bacterium]|nr:metallophosphoesterase family protein [Spirochaetales bacterium]